MAVAALAVWGSLIPAHAVPPTATPSPGYDARLQEQRAASRAAVAPVAKAAYASRSRARIDLQGVITEIAERRGLEAPLSRRIVELIRQAERAAKGSPGLTPEQIRAAN